MTQRGRGLAAQDFEALTPNLLARTMETVEGGGIVVLLLSTLRSLTQLFTLTMDVHARLRTESHQEVAGARRAEEPISMDDKLIVAWMTSSLLPMLVSLQAIRRSQVRAAQRSPFLMDYKLDVVKLLRWRNQEVTGVG